MSEEISGTIMIDFLIRPISYADGVRYDWIVSTGEDSPGLFDSVEEARADVLRRFS